MHELALAESILDLVSAQAREQVFSRVARIRLLIGALAHVEADALVFGFDAVSRGTVAEGATLDIVTVAGKGACVACGSLVEVSRRGDPCPRCGGFDLLVAGGDELRVIDLEVT